MEIERAEGEDRKPLLTKTEMKKISEVLWNRPWPSYEEADRTSIYTRL